MMFKTDGGSLTLCTEAVSVLENYAQRRSLDLEAGGLLIGRELIGVPSFVVDEVTVPLPGDRRWRYRFDRNDPGHQALLDDRWSASQGTSIYLGDWHTHPEDDPEPSEQDIYNWGRKVREDQVGCSSTFFIIVGRRRIRVWAWGRGQRLREIPPVIKRKRVLG